MKRENIIGKKERKRKTAKKKELKYFYRCTVHFEDSLIITYQQMH
jgi:hypothetical protein